MPVFPAPQRCLCPFPLSLGWLVTSFYQWNTAEMTMPVPGWALRSPVASVFALLEASSHAVDVLARIPKEDRPPVEGGHVEEHWSAPIKLSDECQHECRHVSDPTWKHMKKDQPRLWRPAQAANCELLFQWVCHSAIQHRDITKVLKGITKTIRGLEKRTMENVKGVSLVSLVERKRHFKTFKYHANLALNAFLWRKQRPDKRMNLIFSLKVFHLKFFHFLNTGLFWTSLLSSLSE